MRKAWAEGINRYWSSQTTPLSWFVAPHCSFETGFDPGLWLCHQLFSCFCLLCTAIPQYGSCGRTASSTAISNDSYCVPCVHHFYAAAPAASASVLCAAGAKHFRHTTSPHCRIACWTSGPPWTCRCCSPYWGGPAPIPPEWRLPGVHAVQSLALSPEIQEKKRLPRWQQVSQGHWFDCHPKKASTLTPYPIFNTSVLFTQVIS